MFFYISAFVAILLAFIIFGYFFLPNSEFSLSFNKKYFIIIVVTLIAILIYLLGFGFYNLYHDHQEIRIIHIDNQSQTKVGNKTKVQVDSKTYLVDGIDGKLAFLHDKKILLNRPYQTVLFTWKPLKKDLKATMKPRNGNIQTKTIKVQTVDEPLYHQIQSALGAKYVYHATFVFPLSGTWQVIFGEKPHQIALLSIEVKN